VSAKPVLKKNRLYLGLLLTTINTELHIKKAQMVKRQTTNIIEPKKENLQASDINKAKKAN
jgi:hypothetical protein